MPRRHTLVEIIVFINVFAPAARPGFEGQLLSLNNPDTGGPPELPFLVFRFPP
jgi:hypothetical protein